MIDPVEFPLVGKRFSGATRWQTDVQEGLNGTEVRNADWQDSLRRFDISPGVKTLTDQQLVEAWHMACQGAAIGFLMRDWKDYKVTQAQLSLGSGAYSQGVMSAVGGSTTVFQLEKLYSNGYRARRRKITRPAAGSVTLYDASNNLIAGGYTLDTVTGRVTFAVPPGFVPTWTGNFFVPSRFESDEIEWDVIQFALASGKGHGEMPQIVIVEVRE